MRQQFAGVVLLHGDHLVVDLVHAFAVLGQLLAPVAGGQTIGKIRSLPIIARNMEIEIGINAARFELGNEIVQPVKLAGVKDIQLRLAILPDAAGRSVVVHVVKTNDIDAQAREPGGNFAGVLVAGEVAGKGEIHAQKPDSFAAAVHKMTVLDLHKSGSPGWTVVQPGDVQNGSCRRQRECRNDKWKHFFGAGDGSQ